MLVIIYNNLLFISKRHIRLHFYILLLSMRWLLEEDDLQEKHVCINIAYSLSFKQ